MKIIISNLKMSGKYNMVKLLKPGPVSKLCLKYNVHIYLSPFYCWRFWQTSVRAYGAKSVVTNVSGKLIKAKKSFGCKIN